MKNLTEIKRSVDTDKTNSTPLSNTAIKDKSLSFEALGLLWYLLSLPKDWSISKEQISKSKDIGRSKFRKIWKELENAGYIISKRLQNGNGPFYWSYQVSDKPLNANENAIGSFSTGRSSDVRNAEAPNSVVRKVTDRQKTKEKKIQEKKTEVQVQVQEVQVQVPVQEVQVQDTDTFLNEIEIINIRNFVNSLKGWKANRYKADIEYNRSISGKITHNQVLNYIPNNYTNHQLIIENCKEYFKSITN